MHVRKTLKFSFITLLIMPPLSKHKKSDTIGMLQAGLLVTDIAQYYNCHPSTTQVLRDRYQTTGTVKDRHRPGQPRNATCCPDATLTVFFVLWRYPLCVKIKGDQHDNAPAHTARLTVNFQAANIILVLDRPPLSQDMSAIEPLSTTLKSKGIAI